MRGGGGWFCRNIDQPPPVFYMKIILNSVDFEKLMKKMDEVSDLGFRHWSVTSNQLVYYVHKHPILYRIYPV